MSKDQQLILRIESKVKEELLEEAEMFHMTLSEYMRHFIDNRYEILPKHGE